ncbi:MAG: esterase-like activity of phytase family protein, partial [Gemmatimonadales bacterium]|nr:esterase-like activity of phytase family protein [Gemmatimonadales bacterium]
MRVGVPRFVPIACGLVLLACAVSAREAAAQRLVVVNKSANSLSLIDPSSRQEIARVPTGFAPHEVAVSADGRHAFVTDYGTADRPGNTVTIVDLGTMSALGSIDLGEHTRPHGIATAADGTVWVTTEGSRHVLQLDPDGRRVLRAVRTGQQVTHQVVVVEDAGRAYTANIGSGTVTVVDAATGTVVAHVSTGAGAEGIAVSPDGAKVYV